MEILLVALIGLVAASIFDILKMEVPLWIFPGVLLGEGIVLGMGYGIVPLNESIIAGIVCFGFMFIFMLISNMGGADAMAAGIIGVAIGYMGFYAVLFAFLCSLPYVTYLKIKREERDYPFLPFMLCGFVIAFIVIIIRNSMMFDITNYIH